MSRKKKTAAAPAGPPVVEHRPPAASPLAGEFERKPALILLGLALLTRFLWLARADLWCDEILFIGRSHAPMPFYQVLYKCWIDLLLVTHLPFPEVVQNLFMWIFYPFVPDIIHQTWLLRVPAVLWGAGSVVLFYSLCTKIFRRPAARIAGLTLCFFSYPVYYSRETYYYAPLVFFSAATLNLYLEFILRGQATKRRAALFVFCLSALVLSHLTGILLGGLLLVVHLGYLGYAAFLRKTPPLTPFLKRSAGLFVVPVLLAAPFVIKLAAQSVEAAAGGSSMHAGQILYYVIGKFTLGTASAWPVAGALIVLAGAAYLLRKGPQRDARVLLVVLAAIGLPVFGFSAARTQFQVRYFNALLPILLGLWMGGIEVIARGAAKLLKRSPAAGDAAVYGLGGLFVLGHILFFLPPLYQLRAKGVDYGGLARWLNTHLRPDTPYFFENGGWDLRFVPGYFETPGLSHAITLAFPGPDFEPALRKQQEDLMARFPESACIERVEAPWDRLPRAYRRKAELRNEPMLRLIRRGIWFEDLPPGAAGRAPGDLNIWYNTLEDALALAREAGRAAHFVFDNTECAQRAEGVYVHAAQGNRMAIRIINVTGQPRQGRIRLVGALNTSQDNCSLYMSWQNQVIAQTSCVRRSVWTLETPPITLPEGEHSLKLMAAERGGQPVLNVAVQQAEFIPIPELEAGRPRPAQTRRGAARALRLQ